MLCCTGLENTFDAGASSDADGDILVYTWEFGDGETAEGTRVTHRYEKSGKYMVTLGGDDGRNTVCSRSKDTLTALVNEQPVAKIKVR